MIEIDDKKKKSQMQKKRELKNIFNLQIGYSYLLVFITKLSKVLDCKEILLIGVILYLIISIMNIKKINLIKHE